MRKITIVVFAGVSAACGCSGDTSAPDVDGFRELTAQISATAASHRGTAAAMAASPDCETERDRYAAELQPMLDRLCAMSGDMDSCMEAMGHDGMADMNATCMEMCSELGHHARQACTSPDAAARQAETERHADAMMALAHREDDRSVSMQGMMGSGSMPMMSGGTCHP